MTPNIAKSHKDTAKFYDEFNPADPRNDNNGTTTDVMSSNTLDGDHAGKTLDQGANKAMGASGGLADGIHESATQTSAAGDKTTGQGTSMFSKDGMIGKAFTAEGAIGGTAQAVGGPFDKQGAIGQHFNPDGTIGGMVQKNLAEGNEQH